MNKMYKLEVKMLRAAEGLYQEYIISVLKNFQDISIMDSYELFFLPFLPLFLSDSCQIS